MQSQGRKTEVYLIRHAITDYNRQNKFQGSTNTSLSEEGISQSLKLKERLIRDKLQPDKIYVSRLQRTMQTIKPWADSIHMQPEVLDGIEEIDGGDLEGLELSQIIAYNPEVILEQRKHPYMATMPNGETGKQVYDRSVAAYEKVLREHKGERVVIVSHGYVLQLLLGYLKGLEPEKIPHLICENTAITKVEIDASGHSEIVMDKDASHLQESGEDAEY